MSPNGTASVTRLQPLAAPDVMVSRNDLPLLLSIPHAGRDYPSWLLGLAWGGRASLETLEDPLVDRLAWRARARGFGAVIARCPRAAIDCNRAEHDLDPAVIKGAAPMAPEGRARSGLGLVPSRTLGHGQLWRRPLDAGELDVRLDQAHRPYHQAIGERLSALSARHGVAILLDLHSMPPRPRAHGQAQIVIGDRHGGSAASWITAEAARIARALGFSVALNDPFAGGHIVAAHGRPNAGAHALQIEIDRTAYCQRDCRTPGPGFERAATLIEALAMQLGEAVATPHAVAAE